MVVGLLLEADVEVCFEAVAVFGEQEEPFEHIPQIEADVEQLPLLGGVNALVVELHGIELLHGEDDAKEVDGIKATHERETPNVDYLGHLQKLYGNTSGFCLNNLTADVNSAITLSRWGLSVLVIIAK